MADSSKNRPLLSLRDVGVNYSKGFSFRRNRLDRWVLRHISFELHRGESLGVIGRNGIGKSTLLRTMAGINHPDEGSVHLQKNCNAALLTLGTGLMPELTGRKNIFLGGMLLGMTREEIEARYDDIVDFAELGEYIDQPLNTYSSGMRSRLSFSLSLQRQPDILLLDEVLGVGDAAFKQKSIGVMKDLIKSDQTVVLVSHSGATIRELCTRAIWIEGGAIRAQGDPDEVVTQYEELLLGAKKKASAASDDM